MLKKLQLYKRRYDRSRARAYEWWPMLEAAYHYCVPGRNLFYYSNRTQGSQKNIKVYDTTAVAAAKNLVSKIHQSLTPPQQVWANHESPHEVEDDVREEANKRLQKYTDIMFSYIHNSNFDVIINEAFYDFIIGTGIIVINEGSDDNPLMCSSIPLEQVAIEESINHLCETVFRTWGETRISDIQSLWPKATLSGHMIQALAEDPNATVKELIEAVIYDNDDKKTPYSYVLWHGQDLLLDEKQESSPFIVFRWAKINNEIFGRGPVIDALPSIISLNTLAFFQYTATNMNVCRPIMAYSDGVFNPFTFKISANTIIPVSPNNNGQFPLQPFPPVGDIKEGQMTAHDLRNQINQLMFANPLGPVEAPAKTATELQLRQRNLAEEIGPLFTRMQQEFLDRVISRVRYILEKKGFLPSDINVEGQDVKIKYKSPLTLSQGQQDVQSFMAYIQTMQQVVGPEMTVTYMDNTKLAVWLAEKLGVDATLINTQEQMQGEFDEKEQQMEQMQMMQMQGMMEQQGGAPGGEAGAGPAAGP